MGVFICRTGAHQIKAYSFRQQRYTMSRHSASIEKGVELIKAFRSYQISLLNRSHLWIEMIVYRPY